MTSQTFSSSNLGSPAKGLFGKKSKKGDSFKIPTSEQDVIIPGENDLTPTELDKLRMSPLHGQLVNYIKQEYAKCKQSTTGQRNQWYLNLSFYKGDQYVAVLNNTVMKTRAPLRSVRLVINRVRPMIRTELAKMISQDPTSEVIPSSTDDEDLLAAEVGNSVWETLKREGKLKDKYLDTAFWQSTCGVGYIKTYWDKDNDKICYSALSPFHVLVPELLTRDIEDQPYVLNVFTKSLVWVKEHYGDVVPKDHKPSVISTSEIMETQYMNMKGSDRKAEPDSCLFIEAWIKPGTFGGLPKGGMITVVDDFIIQAATTGLPYEHGEYPFTKFEGIPSGGYYPTSAIEDFISLQVELNSNRSKRVEHRNLVSRPQYMAPKGAIDVSKWQNRPGQVIEYNTGMGKPEALQQPVMPNSVLQESDELLRDMEDISGQHQVSKGKGQGGVTSGTAISFLQEADNSFMGTVFFSIERGYEKLAKQSLQLAVQFWDSPRLIKIVGRDGSFSVKSLMGADLKNGTDIHTETGSSLPESKAARNAMIMDMINRQILPPQDGLEMLNLPNFKAYYERINADRNAQLRENQKMREMDPEEIIAVNDQAQQMKDEMLAQYGIDSATMNQSPIGGQIDTLFNQPIVPVNDWDNHDEHIKTIELFMKSQGFEALDPAIKEQFARHRQAHKDKAFETQMTEAMQGGTPMEATAQEMMGGMPPEEGGQPNQFSGLPSESGESPVDQAPPIQ